MKKFAVPTFVLFFICVPLPPVFADAPVVRITSTLHQNFTGEFRNDNLAQELTPSGRLGLLVFVPLDKSRIWVIDPALIDEVRAMSNGYTLATEAQPIGREIASDWLMQLKSVTAANNVIALAYGNPDVVLGNRLAPSELRMYYAYGKIQLESVLGRVVRSEPQRGWSIGRSQLSATLRESYGKERRALTRLTKVVISPEVWQLRVRLARLLSPKLDSDSQGYFSFNARTAVAAQVQKLRVISGKYQITTEKSELPVTVINDFPVEVSIGIEMLATNSRILVESFTGLKLPPNSKTQLGLKTQVIAPGQTIVLAQIIDIDGSEVAPPSILALNATVIDPRVTWFTTGAAILLLLAAITQSVRRVRKGRKVEI